jgi:hypothetical protein
MQNKTMPIAAYILYTLFSAALYGLFAFFIIYRGLAGSVMLAAYLWNIAFIIAFLIADKAANDLLLSDEVVITRKNYFLTIVIHVLSFISFKTTLYFFYSFVLIVSRISLLEPGLISGEFRDFVLALEYCLILVVVFDKFIEYLLKDNKRIKRITAKFERFENFIKTRRGRKADR